MWIGKGMAYWRVLEELKRMALDAGKNIAHRRLLEKILMIKADVGESR